MRNRFQILDRVAGCRRKASKACDSTTSVITPTVASSFKAARKVSIKCSCSAPRRCGEVVEWLARLAFNPGTTPHDGRLKSCGVCRCLNKIALWIPVELQTADLTDFQKEQFKLAAETQGCWKNP